MKLDVSRLPTEALYGPDGAQVNLATVVTGLRAATYELGRHELVKPVKSFGFAAAHAGDPKALDWNDPYSFAWFVAGWGPDRDRYIANAMRKLRATLRARRSTLELRERGGKAFKKRVRSQEKDGSFKWGDFPWGGAVLTNVGGIIIPTAVSTYLEVEDHAVALLAGGLIGGRMLQLDKPDEYGPNS